MVMTLTIITVVTVITIFIMILIIIIVMTCFDCISIGIINVFVSLILRISCKISLLAFFATGCRACGVWGRVPFHIQSSPFEVSFKGLLGLKFRV